MKINASNVRKLGRPTVALATALSLAASAPVAYAVCNQAGATTAEINLWNTHGCWQEFFLWQYQAYRMRESDWSGRGWNDACNRNLEYPKHWNASYLITYGLVDNFFQSFHGTSDYRGAAEKYSGNYHPAIRHVPSDRTDIFGQYSTQFLAPDLVRTACPLYNFTVANANPASRGGTMVHEGFHGWLIRWGYDPSHFNGPQGNCTMNGAGCDYFYWHGISEYAFGAMWQQDGTANRFHSPNQAQVEYLCDVADQPEAFVPASVRLAAAADANARAAQRFINGPGYTCGSPRPW